MNSFLTGCFASERDVLKLFAITRNYLMHKLYKLFSFLFIMLLVLSQSAYACPVPFYGNDIDAAINVQKIAKDKYRIIAEKSVRHLDYGATFGLIYYENDDYQLLPKYGKEYTPKLIGKHYVLDIKVKQRWNHTPYAYVMWHSEALTGCVAFGESKALNF